MEKIISFREIKGQELRPGEEIKEDGYEIVTTSSGKIIKKSKIILEYDNGQKDVIYTLNPERYKNLFLNQGRKGINKKEENLEKTIKNLEDLGIKVNTKSIIVDLESIIIKLDNNVNIELDDSGIMCYDKTAIDNEDEDFIVETDFEKLPEEVLKVLKNHDLI